MLPCLHVDNRPGSVEREHRGCDQVCTWGEPVSDGWWGTHISYFSPSRMYVPHYGKGGEMHFFWAYSATMFNHDLSFICSISGTLVWVWAACVEVLYKKRSSLKVYFFTLIHIINLHGLYLIHFFFVKRGSSKTIIWSVTIYYTFSLLYVWDKNILMLIGTTEYKNIHLYTCSKPTTRL